jgi:hypothetical protein
MPAMRWTIVFLPSTHGSQILATSHRVKAAARRESVPEKKVTGGASCFPTAANFFPNMEYGGESEREMERENECAMEGAES